MPYFTHIKAYRLAFSSAIDRLRTDADTDILSRTHRVDVSVEAGGVRAYLGSDVDYDDVAADTPGAALYKEDSKFVVTGPDDIKNLVFFKVDDATVVNLNYYGTVS